jgi:MoaA/NifB/PqqE/SkfB family radical SAM enzyme
MCYIWQNPTLPKEEVSLSTLEKIPNDGINHLNLTGGEPTLRRDLMEIVDLLYLKAMTFEISSNGLYSERLEPVIKKYPDVKIRFSLEGIGLTNDQIRGEKDGFNNKVKGLLRLKELGGTDLGFAITIQDDNIQDLVPLFELTQEHGFELATSALHNGFQFHKHNNVPYNRLKTASHIEDLITKMLESNTPKNWFRAYLNLGLIAKVLGNDRLLRCTAGTDLVFIDPWSDVYACNVRPDLKMGNFEEQSWDEIYYGSHAEKIREQVHRCKQNCWMVGTAKTAMRHPRFARVPKLEPLLWVVRNKLRVTFGADVDFNKNVDYSNVYEDKFIPHRISFLDNKVKREVQSKQDGRYEKIGEYFNR